VGGGEEWWGCWWVGVGLGVVLCWCVLDVGELVGWWRAWDWMGVLVGGGGCGSGGRPRIPEFFKSFFSEFKSEH
jgi:hypothetical protein